jgi:hypothetical protein
MRGTALVGAAAVVLGITGCVGDASNPPCAPSGCAGVSGIVQTCGSHQPRRCHSVHVHSVEILDDHGHVVQRSVGDELDGPYVFHGLNPGRYTLRTRALGRTWTRPVQAPINATIRSDITIAPR